MTEAEQIERPLAAGDRVRRIVPLRELAVAPENLRFGEAPDDAIPELAATIRAAGVMQPLTVRPGRRREAPWMALDGRRRLLALTALADAGEIDGGYGVEVFVETEPGRQAAAAVLTNTAAPVHVADVIVAIGRMLKAKLTIDAIAAALGYAQIEIRKLAALSAVPLSAIEALRAGRITLRQTKLIARLPDRKAQTAIAREALDGQGFQEWRVREALEEGQVTTRDARWTLVGADRYAAGGGRVESDLFGELPDRILDPELLTALWLERAGQVAEILEKEGLAATIAVGDAWEPPEGLDRFGYVRAYELEAEAHDAFVEARNAHATEVQNVGMLDPAGDGLLVGLARVCRARAVMDGAGAPGREVRLLVLRPDREMGLDAVSYGPPSPVEDDQEVSDEVGTPASETAPVWPEVDIDGVSHAQHRARTEMATLGLSRAIADDPRVALIGVVARLYELVVLRRYRGQDDSATVLTADVKSGSRERSIDTLNGEVERRLAARRAAHEVSGLGTLDWIAGLGEAERLELLAEVFAATIDLREERTDRLRHAARAEARTLARLSDADLAVHWTPDSVFLGVHGKPQLLEMLSAMGVEGRDAAGLRKPELIERVAAEAAKRRWIPDALTRPRADVAEPAADGTEPPVPMAA